MSGRHAYICSGNKILTKRGYRNIEDIGLYDKVLTHTGAFREIENVARLVADADVCVISACGHPAPIVCMWLQKFFAYDTKRKIARWTAAKYLRVGMCLATPVNMASVPAVFTFSDTDASVSSRHTLELDRPEYWFLMGHFCGSGTLNVDGTIEIAARDQTTIHRLQRILPLIGSHTDICANCSIMTCANLTWHAILSPFGAELYRRVLPEWVQDAPKKLLWAFLHGYICSVAAYQQPGRVHCIAASADFAGGMQRVCLKLGILALISAAGTDVSADGTGLVCIDIIPAERVDCGKFAWFPITNIATRAETGVATHGIELCNDSSYCIANILTADMPRHTVT
jgi:hypothetical protein